MTEGAESIDGTTDIMVEPRDNGVAVVRFSGRLDFVLAPTARERLAQSIASGYRHLLIDLSGVEFVDSSGLGVLIDGTRKARDAGGDLCIADPHDQVRLLMALTGLEQIIREHGAGGVATHWNAANNRFLIRSKLPPSSDPASKGKDKNKKGKSKSGKDTNHNGKVRKP